MLQSAAVILCNRLAVKQLTSMRQTDSLASHWPIFAAYPFWAHGIRSDGCRWHTHVHKYPQEHVQVRDKKEKPGELASRKTERIQRGGMGSPSEPVSPVCSRHLV